MISGGGGLQFQIKEDEFLGSQMKQVEDYPEELDLWLEQHITEMGGDGLGPSSFSGGVTGVVLHQTPQGGGGQRLGGNLILPQGQVFLQQGGQQVTLQQAGEGLVSQQVQSIPQNFQQQISSSVHKDPVMVQIQQQQISKQVIQVNPQALQQPVLDQLQQQQLNQQIRQQLASAQHSDVQHPHHQSQQVLSGEGNLSEDQFDQSTDALTTNKQLEGKVVMWNQMPEVPNALKDNDGKYPCDKCEYKASRQWNLKKHKLSVHEGVKYSCDECDYKATDQSQVKKHKKSKH